MHDTAKLEAAGIPAVGLYSSAFARQSQFQANKLGFPSAARVFVAHPISDQTPQQLAAKGCDICDDVVLALTDPQFSSAASDMVSCNEDTDSV